MYKKVYRFFLNKTARKMTAKWSIIYQNIYFYKIYDIIVVTGSLVETIKTSDILTNYSTKIKLFSIDHFKANFLIRKLFVAINVRNQQIRLQRTSNH